MYTRDAATTVDVTKQHTLIAGETEDVEFFSTNRDRSNNPEGVDCQYVRILFPLAMITNLLLQVSSGRL